MIVYVLRFDFPNEPPMWAGLHKGALGWAPTILTAMHFDSEEAALQTARNGYGELHAAVASVERLMVES